MTKIKKIQHPHAWELLQARIDEAIVTGQPMIERPFWFESTVTGQCYYDVYGAVGYPTEVSDKDEGMPGYLAVVGIVKPKTEGKKIQDAVFQLLAERESRDVETLLDHMIELREEYGFGIHPGLMQSWIGDYERYVLTIALRNERLMAAGGEKMAILITPPNEIGKAYAFDEYHRALASALRPEKQRFFFGGNDLLKNKLMEFKRNNPAVFAIGGLVHSLVSRCMWADTQGDQHVFNIEGEGEI